MKALIYFLLISHHRSLGHTVVRETQNLQVPYYVDKNFDNNYHGEELEELEKHIEKDYIDYVQTSCRKEKQQSKFCPFPKHPALFSNLG